MKQARTDKERLLDIIESIDAVGRHPVATWEQFEADEVIRYFMLKHVEIIGEAAYKLSTAIKDGHPEIPWNKLETCRHILVHDYWQIDWDILWKVVTVHLAPLRVQIEAILANQATH